MYEHRRLLLRIKRVFNSFDNPFIIFVTIRNGKIIENISSCILGNRRILEWEEKKSMEEGESRNWKESHFLFVKQRGLSATLFFRDAPATFSFSSLFLPVLKKVWFACKEIRMRGDGENEYFMKYFEVLNEV